MGGLITLGVNLHLQKRERKGEYAIKNKNKIYFKGGCYGKARDTYKYHFKVRNKIIHSGITKDLERREEEHQQKWSNGHIKQVGHRTTEETARDWENKQKKS